MVTPILRTNQTVASAISEWQAQSSKEIRPAREVMQIAQLKGTGNSTFKLDLKNETSVVLRLNGATESLGVDRKREQHILKLVSGIGAEVNYFGRDFCVFEFITASGCSTIKDLAECLASTHRITSAHDPIWDPNDTISDYMELLPAIPENLRTLARNLTQINWSASNYGLCHIDPNPANFIMTTDGIRLIDWEYARFGPTVYDLAVLVQTHKMSDTQIERLLSCYPEYVDRNLLKQARLTYDLIELLWLVLNNKKHWSSRKIASAIDDLFEVS